MVVKYLCVLVITLLIRNVVNFMDGSLTMIDKLESVKEVLEYYANDDHWKHIYSSGSALPSDRCKLWQPAQKALAELNEVINIIRGKDNGK